MMKPLSPAGRLVLIAALCLPVLILYCQRAEKPAPSPGPEPPQAATPMTAAAAGPGEKSWQEKCSFCHSQAQLHGKTEADVRRALDRVPAMGRFKDQLTDEDIKSLAALLGGAPAVEEYKYITAEACQTCHPDHVRQWGHSLHALAHTEPVYDYYFIRASQESGQKLEVFCARCHTPIGVLDRNIPFARPVRGPGDTRVSEVESQGVQCDFCHLIAGYTEINNGGYTVKPARVKLGPYPDAVSDFHETAFSALHRSADLCGTCHNVSHPGNGIVLEATYTEWKESPYAQEGVICQDCHLTRGLTKRETQPGQAAVDGPQRDHVSEHFFVGPNLLYASAPGAEELRQRSEQLLRSAARIELGEPIKGQTDVTIPVLVTNIGAGHYLPTGVTEIRELWLEVKIADREGKEVFHSGGLGPDGNLEPGTIVYFTDVKDASGTSTTKFWNTVQKVSDHRLPPRITVTEKISAPLSQDRGPFTIQAALQYRSVSPRGLAEVGAPSDLVAIPVFTLAESTRKIW